MAGVGSEASVECDAPIGYKALFVDFSGCWGLHVVKVAASVGRKVEQRVVAGATLSPNCMKGECYKPHFAVS